MPSRVFINTECSQCGGSLNLEEGSNAVSCPYCASSFLITGYDKILSYYIAKRPEERKTAIQALARRYLLTLSDHCRIEGINLFHLPYYYLRGKIFQLVHHHPVGDADTPGEGEPRITIDTRHLDKSFLATSLEGLNLYSLGIRTSVLTLRLFNPATACGMGTVYPVTVSTDRALEIGLGKNYKRSPDLRVISRMLSIVYAPVWEVNVRGLNNDFSIIIDALGESITEHHATFRFLTDHRPDGQPADLPAISFHALACPNCGWDIPPDPKLYVFVCRNCNRAWESGADGLVETGGAMAQTHTEEEQQELIYLPFWIFPGGPETPGSHHTKTAAARLFIPAFTVRDLGVMHRLAVTFTSVQPELELRPLSGDLHHAKIEGASLRWEDARELAALLLCNGNTKFHLLSPEASARQLVWLPFYEKGIYLRDAILNAGIQKAKISSPPIPIPVPPCSTGEQAASDG